jgi:hypothetical protein
MENIGYYNQTDLDAKFSGKNILSRSQRYLFLTTLIAGIIIIALYYSHAGQVAVKLGSIRQITVAALVIGGIVAFSVFQLAIMIGRIWENHTARKSIFGQAVEHPSNQANPQFEEARAEVSKLLEAGSVLQYQVAHLQSYIGVIEGQKQAAESARQSLLDQLNTQQVNHNASDKREIVRLRKALDENSKNLMQTERRLQEYENGDKVKNLQAENQRLSNENIRLEGEAYVREKLLQGAEEENQQLKNPKK